MLEKIIVVLFILFSFSYSAGNFITADESYISLENSKKYNLSICAIFKNEARNLKDWIDYHHDLGVDHFYLYNTGSRDRFLHILIPYMNEDLVTLVNWPSQVKKDYFDDYGYALSIQVPAYENAVNFVAREETKWLILMDIDECLVCPKENLADLLIDYDNYPFISLSSDTCDGTIKDPIPLKKIFPQSLEHTNSDTQIVDKSIAKMIFKPDLCIGFIWPPYRCRFNTEHPGIEADLQELRINHYLNRNRNFSSFKNKVSSKQDVGYSLQYEAAGVDFMDVGPENENRNRPMYIYMPEFLKKLKSKLQEDGRSFKD